MGEHPDANAKLAALTDKQREVLDLLLQHKQYKEIADELGIKVATVQQRFDGAKIKLGGTTRSQVLATYVDLCSQGGAMVPNRPFLSAPANMGTEKSLYGFSQLSDGENDHHVSPQVLEAGAVFRLSDAGVEHTSVSEDELPLSMKGLGALDRYAGVFGRVIAFTGFAALLLVITANAIEIGKTLSELF